MTKKLKNENYSKPVSQQHLSCAISNKFAVDNSKHEFSGNQETPKTSDPFYLIKSELTKKLHFLSNHL